MKIPDYIKPTHIRRAIAEMKRVEKVPPRRGSTKYDLLFAGKLYPPRYVLVLANRYARKDGRELGDFRGGSRTNKFFVDRGFTIVDRKGKRISLGAGRGEPQHPNGRSATKKSKKTQVTSLPSHRELEFQVRTSSQVRVARKKEEVLVSAYRDWLGKQQRVLVGELYGSLRCDAYEKKRNNLIEAKSSIKREYLRMAVGQLFDYAYLGRGMRESPNLAILVPSKPLSDVLTWLKQLKISVVWRSSSEFKDNAEGQFA